MLNQWMQIVSVVICIAGTAWADARVDARRHFEVGMALIAEGRCDDGVAELLHAYSVRPHPNVLFNIAKAYENAGRATDAVAYFRRYLETNPSDASEVSKVVEKLETRRPRPLVAPQVEGCDGSSGAGTLPTSCERVTLCVSGSCDSQDATFPSLSPDVRAAVTERPAERPAGFSWKPWAVAAGVVLAAAVISGVFSNTLFDQARTQRFASDAAVKLELSHGTAVGADVGFGLGGVLGFVALVLLLTDASP